MLNTNHESADPVDKLAERRHFFQVDVLKASMIILVIINHSITREDILGKFQGSFWIRMAIPVFLIIMGFNAGLSFQYEGKTSLKELYSVAYFKKKFMRFVLPFLILYVVSTFTGLLYYGFDFNSMIEMSYEGDSDFGILALFLYLPFYGIGNWFIMVIFQFIVIIPGLFYLFSRRPKTVALICLISDFIIQQIPYHLYYINEADPAKNYTFMFSHSIFWFLTAIILGLWFAKFGHGIRDKHNLFVLLLLPLSLPFISHIQSVILNRGSLVEYKILEFPLALMGDYHFMVFPYAAFIFLLGMTYLPDRTTRTGTKLRDKISRTTNHIIEKISRATYHILLFQIFYFAIYFANYHTFSYMGIFYILDPIIELPLEIIFPIANVIICVPLGILWFEVEKKVKNYIRTKRGSDVVRYERAIT